MPFSLLSGCNPAPVCNLTAAAMLLLAPALQAQGPGLVQASFPATDIGKVIGSFPTPGPEPSALDFQHGYFFIGSGSSGSGTIGTDIWYNISNPRGPQLVSSLPSTGHKVHTIGYWQDFGISAHVATTGFRVLDMKNRSARPFNDVDVFPIWVSVQAPICYRAENGYRTRSNRMKVLSVANPDAPAELANIDFGGSLSFYPANTHVVGNLMIASATQQKGVATFDIGNPLSPQLLGTLVTGDITYTSMVYGSRIYTAETGKGVRVYDFSNPAQIVDLGKIPVPNTPRYVSLKDGKGYCCPGAAKLVVFSTSAPPVTSITNSYPLTRSADFTFPIGNMVAIGGSGGANLSGLVAVEQAPDTQGPAVTFASPTANAVNQPLTSRVGFIMSDQIDVTSLSTSTFIVRPVGGSALPGTYSTQNGIINFHPAEPLAAGIIYETVLPAGGIRDSVGNAIATTHTQLFSTGSTVNRPPAISAVTSSATFSLVGNNVTFTASATDPDATPLEFSWDFGDGVTTGFSSSATANHAFTAPGRYSVIMRVTDGNTTASLTRLQVVNHPQALTQPVISTSIVHDPFRVKVWSVNPDSDTITRFNASTLTKEQEVATPAHPTHLAIRPGYSEIWTVASRGDAIRIFDALTFVTLADIPLGYGAQPQGIVFSADGVSAFVALAGPGSVLKINASARTEIARLPVCPQPCALALHGHRLFVSRFISPDSQGEVHEIDADNLTVTRVIPLALDPGPDAASAGRGVPNYLTHMAVTPDGRRLFIPSKKDNIQRGVFRDGQPLPPDITVRSILSQVDLLGNTELTAARKDVDNHGLPSAIVFSPAGDLAFVAYQDNNEVLVFDSANGNQVGGVDLGTGLAPQGLALADGVLFVQNFMTRTVAAFDVSQLVSATGSTVVPLANIPAVSVETLPPQVLAGKKVFYNAADLRMSNEGYLSCATCHLDGGHDGRTWDFTDRGEGLRNTTDLRARAATAHGPIHWSANFDEIQDFEHDIRGSFGGTGFLADAQFHNGTRDQPLGDPKAGLSPELDALAAYLASLTDYPASPHRDSAGNMTPSAIAGRAHFQALACNSCHAHDRFTDSAPGLMHDIGTLKPSTGQRLGAPITGLDTPTLRGLWETPPYLHDGSAATLADVFTEAAAPAGSAHASVRSLSAEGKQQLIDYLLQLDFPRSTPAAPAAVPATPTSLTATASSTSELDVAWTAPVSTTESYVIESITGNGQPQETVVSSAEQALALTALDPASEFTFRIRTRNVHGDSEWFGSALARTWSLYQQWSVDAGFPFATDPALDDDHDGISLWLEYALGLDPHESDPEGAPKFSKAQDHLALNYLQAHPELTYRVETSTNLRDWTALPVNQGTPDANLKVTATTPVDPEDDQRFLRLKVTE